MAERLTGIWCLAREADAAWDRERLLIVLLDARQQIVGVRDIPLTDLTAARLRRAFTSVRLAQARSLIAVHHHPDNRRRSRGRDAALAARLGRVAKEIGIPLFDHAIFSRGRYQSARPQPAHRIGSRPKRRREDRARLDPTSR